MVDIRCVTRRALLGAGAAALVTGCGPPDKPEAEAADVLAEQLRVAQAAAATYEGVAEVDDLRMRAQARVRRLEAALTGAGGKPGPVVPAASGSGLEGALAAESAVLRAHVAAVGELKDSEWRELLAGLVAESAQHESTLLAQLERPPAPTAFPGQPRR